MQVGRWWIQECASGVDTQGCASEALVDTGLYRWGGYRGVQVRRWRIKGCARGADTGVLQVGRFLSFFLDSFRTIFKVLPPIKGISPHLECIPISAPILHVFIIIEKERNV